jgi:hypothetical protein
MKLVLILLSCLLTGIIVRITIAENFKMERLKYGTVENRFQMK